MLQIIKKYIRFFKKKSAKMLKFCPKNETEPAQTTPEALQMFWFVKSNQEA